MQNDTLIKVFDEYEYLYNVITPLTLPFKHIIFLYRSNIKCDPAFAKNAIDILKKHHRTVTFLEVRKDQEDIEKLLDDHNQATIDIGGSHRYLTFYLFEKIINQDRPIIYYDLLENVIKNYRTHSIITEELYRLSIEEMISLSGAFCLNTMHETPDMQDSVLVQSIKNVIDENIDRYASFTHYISVLSQILPNDCTSCIRLTSDKIATIKKYACYESLTSNQVFKIRDDYLIIDKPIYWHLLKNSGSWLESYLYIVMCESGIFDDVKMSAVIEYRERGGNYPISCEIDVMGIQNNRLILVSCKSNKVVTESLHEIKVHNLSFGNFLSRAVICTTDDLNIKNPNIFVKAKEYDIAVIDKTAFKTHGIPNILDKIIKNTYNYERVPLNY